MGMENKEVHTDLKNHWKTVIKVHTKKKQTLHSVFQLSLQCTEFVGFQLFGTLFCNMTIFIFIYFSMKAKPTKNHLHKAKKKGKN